MKEFNITLTAASQKRFRLSADSQDEAFELVNHLIDHSSLLSFADTDVRKVDVECEEVCGGVCEVCGNACDFCGRCTELESGCTTPEQDCEYRCPICGGCLHEDDTDNPPARSPRRRIRQRRRSRPSLPPKPPIP